MYVAGKCNTPHLRAASPSPPPPPPAAEGRSRRAQGAGPSAPAGRSAAADVWRWWAGWHRSQRPPALALHPSPPPLQEQGEGDTHIHIHIIQTCTAHMSIRMYINTCVCEAHEISYYNKTQAATISPGPSAE